MHVSRRNSVALSRNSKCVLVVLISVKLVVTQLLVCERIVLKMLNDIAPDTACFFCNRLNVASKRASLITLAVPVS